jgi:hypothetical protein
MRGDTEADIVAEANRPDRAPCRSIHARSGVARRLHGLAVVVDDTIPRSPGFEVHRAAP